ncbi:hypothetical protein AB0E63_38895 [Kribbella sp. NPDC026596]
MLSTRAEMPRLGTVTFTGVDGRTRAVLRTSDGGVELFGFVAFDDDFDGD